MNKKSIVWGVALLALVMGAVVVFSLGGRSPEGIPSEVSADPQEKEKLSVVTSFYPLAYLAEEIGGEYVDVINLSGARDVHAYTPSSREVEHIRRADVVFYQSEYLEAWMEDATRTLSSEAVRVVEVMNELDETMIRESSGDKHDHEEGGHEDEHEDEHEHEHEDEHGGEANHKEEVEGHDHDHGGIDPHTWADPVLYGEMAHIVKDALVTVGTLNENVYEMNLANLETRLAQLDAQYSGRLTSCERDEVIVSHDAFGYLADRYGFHAHAIAGISTLDEPSAQLLAELRDEAGSGMTHILAEEGSVTAYAETLSRETGLEILTVNPLGRGPLDENKDYFGVMEENLEAFSLALGCK